MNQHFTLEAAELRKRAKRQMPHGPVNRILAAHGKKSETGKNPARYPDGIFKLAQRGVFVRNYPAFCVPFYFADGRRQPVGLFRGDGRSYGIGTTKCGFWTQPAPQNGG